MASSIKCQCWPHIETSQLIWTANQLTGFYMRALNGLHSENTLVLWRLSFLFSQWRLSNFQNFMKMRPNMTNTT